MIITLIIAFVFFSGVAMLGFLLGRFIGITWANFCNSREIKRLYQDNYNKKPVVSCDVCNWSLSGYITPDAWNAVSNHIASAEHLCNIEVSDCKIIIKYPEETV